MELALAIQNIYPNIIRGTDFDVLDDNQGEGPYIKWYNTEIDQPNQAELETAWVEVVKGQELENIKKQKAIDINKIATISDQLNQLGGLTDMLLNKEIERNPEFGKELWVVKSKEMLEGIKNILNK